MPLQQSPIRHAVNTTEDILTVWYPQEILREYPLKKKEDRNYGGYSDK
jgi:hypothetical protein